MNSKYDSIKTAEELVKEVMAHGLSLNAEDICRAQDIFGHSTIEELDFLANDIGRNNEKGEPDPKGTWSSGRRPTRPVFYQILFNIWNWENATRFWNEHTNPERADFVEMRKSLNAEKKAVKKLTEEKEILKGDVEKLAVDKYELSQKCGQLQEKVDDQEREIIRLKAKLYDLMMKEG